MDSTGQLFRERRVDGALALKARLATKGLGNNCYPKMGLTPGPSARVAAVEFRLVDHLKPLGSEFGL